MENDQGIMKNPPGMLPAPERGRCWRSVGWGGSAKGGKSVGRGDAKKKLPETGLQGTHCQRRRVCGLKKKRE